MKRKFLIIGIIAVLLTAILFSINEQQNNNSDTLKDIKKSKLDIKSLFTIYGIENNFEIQNGEKIWYNVEFELNPENEEIYNEIIVDPKEKVVVIYPIFTAAAYSEPGFYTYFRGECDTKCLTVDVKESYPPLFASSGNGFQVLSLLGYEIISDIEVDQNPRLLEEYDKVILLHNEYVTKKEFNAIISHPNVLYLYPNALYAEVDFNENSITLERGHNYPESSIRNGFDWKFDNSELEYNTTCKDLGFDKIDNGWMLNCYPETAIHQSKVLLKMIKEF